MNNAKQWMSYEMHVLMFYKTLGKYTVKLV
jgi:hypothetical protein